MSIKLFPGGTRLTVLGSGYSNSSFESGDGLTEDGKLWEDIAGDLGYDFGEDVDWDEISGGEGWTDDLLYIDAAGNIYSPEDATVSELDTLISEEKLLEISDDLMKTAQKDHELMLYAIDAAKLKSLYGGPVSQERTVIVDHPERPHKFTPPVYYIQEDHRTAVLFLGEKFYHTTQDGGKMDVFDEAVSIRDGSSKSVFWSTCTTLFTDKYLPADVGWIPIQYICWQCLHGSFNHVLVSSNPNTITTSMIQAGESKYETMTIDGKTYYKLIR